MIGVTWNMSIKTFAVCPRVNGIYKITNIKNGRFYIGKAEGKKGFWGRWDQHRRDLRKNRHCCFYLQRAYEKYGEDCFTFEILEIKDFGVELVDLESEYIIKLGAMSFQNGYNMVNKYSEAPKIVREKHVVAKDFELIDPEGNLIKGRNLTQFCEELGFGVSSMHSVITGRLKSYKGYTSTNPDLNRVRREYRFVSPAGELVVFDDMAAFARKIGVNSSSVQSVIYGKNSNVKGYHLEHPSPKNQKNLDRLFNKKLLINKGLGIVVKFIEIRTFSNKHKVSFSCLQRFFAGRQGSQLTVKYNWETPTDEDMELYHMIEEGF